jgi:hypothetical protein
MTGSGPAPGPVPVQGQMQPLAPEIGPGERGFGWNDSRRR